MKILAVIPARGGSKRLPGKNVRPLGGLPLIAWTIRSALESACCVDILVSTDSPAIAEVARGYGASVPWLRPASLATDTASSMEVILHALERYETENGVVDAVILLQPTSPFRTAQKIREAVILFERWGGLKPVVSVSPASSHPAWCFKISGAQMEPFLNWEGLKKRSQDLESAWILNGAIYIASPDYLRKTKEFLTVDSVPLIMEEGKENLDIDTMNDFRICESMLDVNRNL